MRIGKKRFNARDLGVWELSEQSTVHQFENRLKTGVDIVTTRPAPDTIRDGWNRQHTGVNRLIRALSDSPEATMFVDAIFRSVDRMTTTMDGLTAAEINWRPPADGANSLYVLAAHLIGNLEQNFLGVIAGQRVNRDRDREFLAQGDSVEPLARSWSDLKARIRATLSSLPETMLDETRLHPGRGAINVRELFLVMARHSSLHEGHAELTRDLLRARASSGM